MDYFQITCGRCGRLLTAWPDRAERVTDEASAREHIKKVGWIVPDMVADCRCPRCAETTPADEIELAAWRLAFDHIADGTPNGVAVAINEEMDRLEREVEAWRKVAASGVRQAINSSVYG